MYQTNRLYIHSKQVLYSFLIICTIEHDSFHSLRVYCPIFSYSGGSNRAIRNLPIFEKLYSLVAADSLRLAPSDTIENKNMEQGTSQVSCVILKSFYYS